MGKGSENVTTASYPSQQMHPSHSVSVQAKVAIRYQFRLQASTWTKWLEAVSATGIVVSTTGWAVPQTAKD